ncbi:sigma-70 family RNA polymerase sigma factor [Streptomyces europaeiscabiei]|uniref:RNA polymerase sigma factor n=1 Tax=Streptomyces europaeiscabiei TaxID=146819 RepID=UPI0029ADDBD1|nr:sigma-70 family RNA polymerase sigma factor [Streptomyces europaeiscabiei]MDX3696506.1 sigma-70 family RNA polymerase sigma factor [Streptomyces europaeiscabiei]
MYDNPAGALFVFSRRKVADWRQEQDKAPDLPGDDGFGERLAQIAQDRMDMIGLAGLRIDLSRAVARLNPRQCEALLLRYVDGLDRQAVASLMGITVDGVKKLILRWRVRRRALSANTSHSSGTTRTSTEPAAYLRSQRLVRGAGSTADSASCGCTS